MFTFGQWVILSCIVLVLISVVLLVGLMTESLRAVVYEINHTKWHIKYYLRFM